MGKYNGDPLVKSMSEAEEFLFLCFKDSTAAPQFKDFEAEGLDQQLIEDQRRKEILQNFKNLMTVINVAMRAEYENEDRYQLGKRKNVVFPLITVLSLLSILVACGMLGRVLLGYYDHGVLILLYISVGLIGLVIVIMCVFFCCMGGAGIDEDERLVAGVWPVLRAWNDVNKEYGVHADFKEEHLESRGGRYSVKIPETLTLWNERNFEC